MDTSDNILLSTKALQIIMSGDHIDEPILQILGSKKISSDPDKERFRLLISDGYYQISYAVLTPQEGKDFIISGIEMYTVVKLTKYATNTLNTSGVDRRMLVILDIELVLAGHEVGGKIGSPIPLDDELLLSGTRFTPSVSTNLKNELIHPIPSLCPFNNGWVIKARVTNKSSVRHWSSSKGDGKMFSIDLMDEDGEIKATIFRDLVDKYYDMIKVDKIYYISKCSLKRANKNFTSINHIFEMYFTDFTQIEECFEDVQAIPKIKYDFVSIDKIAHMMNGTVIDLIGVCTSASDLLTFTSKMGRELQKRELTIVDQSKHAIALTLWGQNAENFQFEENIIIAVKGAKVHEFRSSKYVQLLTSSLFKINPVIPETDQLRIWLQSEGYHNLVPIDISGGEKWQNMQSKWLTFKQIEDLKLGSENLLEYFQIMGTILIMRAEKMIYKACPMTECNKKVIDLHNGFYRCDKCNKDYSGFKYCLLGSLLVGDFTGNQWMTVFNNDMENILGMSAQTVGLVTDSNQDALISIADAVSYKSYIFRCCIKSETYNDESRLKLTAIKVEHINHTENNRLFISKIEEFLRK